MARIAFPSGFSWGVAASSFQIEGSPLADGAAPSIWHEFAHKKGKIRDGTTGDAACDHFHRYRSDVSLMKDLGIQAYRFSVSWPRVMPEPGRVNPKGLDFYSRLVDALREAGITPFATLFHWDEPVWLERAGGFRARGSVDRFLEYARTVIRRLGDGVKDWISINEPSLFAFYGYATGEFAPGKKMDLKAAFHASHHLLLSHARLVEELPSLVQGGRIGLAHHHVWTSPRSTDPRDVETAAFMDDGANRFFMDGLFFGRYPVRIVKRMRRFLPGSFERDLEQMRGRCGQFIGINYYTRAVYRRSLLPPYTHAREVIPAGSTRSAMWENYPQGIYKTLTRLRDEYGNPPCLITENGYPLPDSPGKDPLSDGERIAYLKDHLFLVGRAIANGCDCRGYFHWSFMDNWEWNKGFTMRFGLVHTDFTTQERAPKASAAWYRGLAQEGILEHENPPQPDTDRSAE